MVPRLQIQVQIRLSTGYGAYLTFSVSLSSCPCPPCSCVLCLKMYVSWLIEEKNRIFGLWSFGTSCNLFLISPQLFFSGFCPSNYYYYFLSFKNSYWKKGEKNPSYALLVFGIFLFLSMKWLEEQPL